MRAPDFRHQTIDGVECGLSDHEGSWTLLIFGRPDCSLCHRMAPEVNKVWESTRGRVKFLFVLTSDASEAETFARETRLAIPLLFDPSGETERRYRVRVSPFAFLVDPHATVRAKGVVNSGREIASWIHAATDGVDGHQSPISNGASNSETAKEATNEQTRI
jgi:peroxiredoxin